MKVLNLLVIVFSLLVANCSQAFVIVEEEAPVEEKVEQKKPAADELSPKEVTQLKKLEDYKEFSGKLTATDEDDINKVKLFLSLADEKKYKVNFQKEVKVHKPKFLKLLNRQVKLGFVGTVNHKIMKMKQFVELKEIVKEAPPKVSTDKLVKVTMRGKLSTVKKSKLTLYTITEDDGTELLLRAPGKLDKINSELEGYKGKSVKLVVSGKLNAEKKSIQVRKIIEVKEQ